MCEIDDWIIAMCLVAMGYKDWKTKTIPFWLLGLTGIFAVVFRIVVIQASIWLTTGGILIGVLFFGVSRWTREAVGYGDSWLILLLGIYLGGIKLLEVLIFASFFASVFSVLSCLRRGWNKKRSIPFVPFLAAAYLGVLFL